MATTGVVALSFALRAILVFHGGQEFWVDESRYEVARNAARAFLAGHLRGGMDVLLAGADHLAFKLIATMPALVEMGFHLPSWLPGLFFALVSTGVIWMVGRVARKAGAGDAEALLGMLLAAASSCLFYYARHFFPYDLSLLFFLAAVECSLGGEAGDNHERDGRGGARLSTMCSVGSVGSFSRSLWTGLWVSLGFLTYNGYWAVGAAILVATTITGGTKRFRDFLRRVAGGAVGLVAPIGLVIGFAGLLGHNLYKSYVEFGAGINQGDYGIAWRFIPEYLWVAEHGLAVLWALCVLAGAWLWVGGRASERLKLELMVTLLLTIMLVIPSDVVPRFTVNARHVRALVPFLCLVSAEVLVLAWGRLRFGRAVAAGAVAALTALAAFGFAAPLGQVFPREFQAESKAAVARALESNLGPYSLLNAEFLRSPSWIDEDRPNADILLRERHPFQFEPYLYEGYSEKERAGYRAHDISMKVEHPSQPLRADGYPGVLRVSFQLRPVAFGSLPQPVVGTGRPGAGDLLFICFPDPAQSPDVIQVGLDHIGGGALLSEPVRIDRTGEHALTIAMGSLFPPVSDPSYVQHPRWLAFKRQLFVSLDGKVLLNREASFHDSLRTEIGIGLNWIGSSGAEPQLRAASLEAALVPPDDVYSQMAISDQTRAESIPKVSDYPKFADLPGPIRIEFQLPEVDRDHLPQPILSSGVSGAGDLIFFKYPSPGDSDTIVIGHDNWGGGGQFSAPVHIDRTSPHSITISMGSLLPDRPEWAGLRQRLYVRLDDRVVLDEPAPFHPSPPAAIAIGENKIGASTAVPQLRAMIMKVTKVAPGEIPPARVTP